MFFLDISDDDEDLNMNVSSRSIQNLHTSQLEPTGRQRKRWDVEQKTCKFHFVVLIYVSFM